MTKNFNTEKLALGLDAWANGVNNPNTATESGAIGSFYLRSSSGGTAPTETYLNLFGTTTGWVKQNLINLNVFNVQAFGALGDGVTDDVVAIRAAIDACIAAGGGVVYFPATANYYKLAHRLTALATFDLSNNSNITFLGDGNASKLKLEANGGNAPWYMWHVHDGSNSIQWVNMYFDTAGVTNANEQTHIFNPSSENTDTHGGANRLQWIGCYWGASVGDGIRFIGTLPANPTFNHDIKYNAFDMTGSRAPLGGQRNSERIRVFYNWLTGSNDQNIDFEPTGTGTPFDWTIYGNLIDANNRGVSTVTLGGNGASFPSLQITFACNQIHNGGNTFVIDSQRLKFNGNICLITNNGGTQVLELQDGIIECQISGNILDSPGATIGIDGVFFAGSAHNPRNNSITNNLIKAYGDTVGGTNIATRESPDSLICGNLCEAVNTNVGKSNPILVRTVTSSADGASVVGNMIIASSAAAKAGVTFAASTGFTLGNSLADYNYVKSAANTIRWDDSSGGTFVDWRGAIGNNGSGITAAGVIVPPSQNIGVTVEGNPGPTARMILFDNATSPMAGTGGVPSPIGSLATSLQGSDASVLWYKETAASLTDTAGWLSTGPSELIFSAQSLTTTATALFLATGMDLANAIATEIQLALPRPGSIRALRIACVAGTGGGNVTFTVRKNGVDTGLAMTMANTGTTASATSAVSFAAGDRVSISVVKTGVISTAQTFVNVTLEFA